MLPAVTKKKKKKISKEEFQGQKCTSGGKGQRAEQHSLLQESSWLRGGLIRIILTVLSSAHLQFWGWFVFIYLRTVLASSSILQDGAHAMATIWLTSIWRYVRAKWLQFCPALCNAIDRSLPGSSIHFPGKNTGVGCHALLQGIFPTRGWNPRLLRLLS